MNLKCKSIYGLFDYLLQHHHVWFVLLIAKYIFFRRSQEQSKRLLWIKYVHQDYKPTWMLAKWRPVEKIQLMLQNPPLYLITVHVHKKMDASFSIFRKHAKKLPCCNWTSFNLKLRLTEIYSKDEVFYHFIHQAFH